MGTISLRRTLRLPVGYLARWNAEIKSWCLAWVAAAWRKLREVLERQRQRRALARLDRRLLRDMGLASDQVERELRKWFWQP